MVLLNSGDNLEVRRISDFDAMALFYQIGYKCEYTKSLSAGSGPS